MPKDPEKKEPELNAQQSKQREQRERVKDAVAVECVVQRPLTGDERAGITELPKEHRLIMRDNGKKD